MRTPTCPTDLSAPGAIDRLLTFHRARFGDARMEEDGGNGNEAGSGEGGDPNASDPPNGGDGGNEAASLEDVMSEMGVTPEQLKGRLEASKKWEQRAKANVPHEDHEKVKAELAELKQASESDVEKQVREAREAGAAEARQASYDGTAKALLRMGLRARGVKDDDLDEIVTQANLAAFADEDGDVDDEKISRYVERNAGTAGGQKWPGTGQDRRGGAVKESGSDLYDRLYGSKTK